MTTHNVLPRSAFPAVATCARAFAATALLLAGTWVQAKGMPEGLDRELDIFQEILRTSLRTADTGKLQAGNVSASYLTGQGAVLRLRLSGGDRHRWHLDMSGMHNHLDNIDFGELAGLDDIEGIEDLDTGFLESIPDIVNDAMTSMQIGLSGLSDERREALKQEQEQLEELRDQEEELRDALRDLRHDSRDLARELREQEREQNNSAAAKQLRDQIAAIEQRQAEKNTKLEELRKLRTSKRAELRAEASKAKELHLADLQKVWQKLDAAVLDTVCGYGATLRALPDNEHLNLLLGNAVLDDGSRGERIYVFRKKDLQGCRSGDSLRAKADIYDA